MSRLRQRHHQVGHERLERHRARRLQERLAEQPAEESRRHDLAEVPRQADAGRLHVRRPAAAGPAVLLRRVRLSEGNDDEADRARAASSSASSMRSPRSAARTRTVRSSTRTTPACFLLKLDWNASAQEPGQPPLQLHVVAAGQRHVRRRLVGTQRERDREGLVERHRRRPDLDAAARSLLNEFRFQFAKENRPRPYNGPTSRARTGRCPTRRSTSRRATASASRSSSRSSITTRACSSTTTSSFLRGAHDIKAGVGVQPRELGADVPRLRQRPLHLRSTDGFLNYSEESEVRRVLGRHDVRRPASARPASTSPARCCSICSRPASATSASRKRARRAFRRPSPPCSCRTRGRPRRTSTCSTDCAGRRRSSPIRSRRPSQVFYAGFIGKTSKGQEFPSNGKIPRDRKMWQPRLGLAWDPQRRRQAVLRANAGIFYGRVPGLDAGLVALHERHRAGRRSSATAPSTAILGPVPAYPNIIPQSQVGSPFDPDVFVFDKNFQNPRTTSASVSWEQELVKDYGFLVKYNYAKGDHITRFVNRNDPLLGSPWSHRPRRRRRERHRRSDDDRVDGQEPLQRRHARHQQAAVEQLRSTR